MKNLKILIAALIGILFSIISCKNEAPKNEDNTGNSLLYEKVEVRTTVRYADTKGIKPEFINQLCSAVIEGKVKAKDFPFGTFVFDSLAEIKIEEAKSALGIKDNSKDFQKELAGICFVENWSLNEKTLKFSKSVKHVCPIRVYENPNEKGQQLMSAPFSYPVSDISSVENKNLELFAENVVYMVDFNPLDPMYPTIKGLNSKKLIDILFDGPASGKVKVFDFDLNIMNRSEKILTNDEVLTALGNKTDTVQQLDADGNVISTLIDTTKAIDLKYYQIKSILFIENWYYDKESFSVKKEILGYGPVRSFEHPSGNGQILKSVPYIIKNN